MTPIEIKREFDRLQGKLVRQKNECARIDSWLRPELATGFTLPRLATAEHRALAALSRTPWLKLVVDNVVQAMYVDSISTEGGPSRDAWTMWLDNGLQSRQVANHRAMVAYGHSYGVASRGYAGGAQLKFMSPRRMAVHFDDPGDVYPASALAELRTCGQRREYLLWLPGVEYRLVLGAEVDTQYAEMGGLRIEGVERTRLDVVPVVQFANQRDLDGKVVGEVTPFIPAAQRINKTSYDRLLAQHFSSWKTRTITGLELPSMVDEEGDSTDQVDEAAAERMKMKLAQDDILVGEDPETRFGTLDATSLEPFVAAWRSDIEALAAVSQTPAHALTGQMVNLSAEALAAARAPLTQKVYERQMNASASYSALIRLGGRMAGDDALADDKMLRVTWQDMEIRSMAQAADALGKLAQSLGVPRRALWGRIPGVERSELLEWERMAEEEAENDPLNEMLRRNRENTTGKVTGGNDE